jgi:hypothetical protein
MWAGKPFGIETEHKSNAAEQKKNRLAAGVSEGMQ